MLKKIQEIFTSKNINFSKPGFYNEPNFINEERKNSSFLQQYGLYIQYQQFDKKYLEHVEEVLPRVAQALVLELKEDGRLGACVDMSTSLMKVLELHDIWSVLVVGAFNANYPDPQITEKYFWHLDSRDTPFNAIMPGHAWLYCPPFIVVDLSLQMQPYKQGQEKYIPDLVLQKEYKNFTATIEDLCGPEVRERLKSLKITEKEYFSRINFDKFTKITKPFEFTQGKMTFRYIPFAYSANEATSIRDFRAMTFSGKSLEEIYKTKIVSLLNNAGTAPSAELNAASE